MRVALAVAVALSLVSASVADQAEAAIRKPTEIAAQNLGTALKRFAEDHGLAMVYRAELVSQLSTGGASGDLTTDEALRALLSGTALTYKYLDEKTVTIVPMATAPAVQGKEDATSAGKEAQESRSFWDRFRVAEADTAAPGVKEEGESTKLEEIVVTAQKREERLSDVPISASVVSGTVIDRSSAGDIKEVLSQVPGVALGSESFGSQVAMRGVSAGSQVFTGSSTTAFYLDSVPFGFARNAIVPEIGVYDLDRIEVLRGPQGTLYGASALNGVVRVLTKDPDLNKFDFKARLASSKTTEVTNNMNYRGDAAVNIPIIADKLAIRATVSRQDWAGWIDKPNRKDANDAQLSTMRLKIQAQPTDALSIDVSAWFDRSDYGAPPLGVPKTRARNVTLDEPWNIDFDAYSVKVGYDFHSLTVTSATSYLDYAVDNISGFVGIDGQRFTFHQPLSGFSQEINIVSTHEGPWRWSLGGIYRDTEETDHVVISQDRIPLLPPVDETAFSESFALFSEVTYAFFDGRLELTGGLRYFEDRQSARADSTLFLPPNLTLPFREATTFDKLTPRAVLNWRPSDNLMFYASYGEGYRSGGHQFLVSSLGALGAGLSVPPFGPDTLTNYEVGAKGGAFDGLVEFDAAVYFMDWQNPQQSVLFPGSVNTVGVLNTESVSGLGVDGALTVKPLAGLELSGAASWNDLKLDADLISGPAVLFKKGERPSQSSEWTISGSASYVFPLGSSAFTGRLSGSVNYASPKRHNLLSGSNILRLTSDPITIGRASFGVDAPEHWTFTIYAENINNESGTVSVVGFDQNSAVLIRPRTIGVQFEYRL